MDREFAQNPEFQRLLHGVPDVDLARLALELAGDAYPDLVAEPYLERLDALGERVRNRCSLTADAVAIVGQINWVLYVEEGFRGNTDDYYDPRNSYLNEVLDRRTGIPISLSALYAAIAARVGLEMRGVNLPCHFLLRAETPTAVLYVDPFHEGVILDRDGCRRRVEEVSGQAVTLDEQQLGACSTLTMVTRMLRNLKGIYLTRRDFAAALYVQRRLAVLEPEHDLEQRDLGVIAIHAGRPELALNPLHAYLNARPEPDDAEIIQAFLKVARRDVASWN